MRLEPHAIARARRAAAARLGGRSRRPTARRRRRRWPPRSSSAPGSRWSTTAPAPTWPAASPRRCSRRRAAAAGSTASSGCSRSTSSGSTGSRRELQPARGAARQPVPRPARPLRRARDDRRPLGRGRRRACRPTARLVLNADDPLIADLGRDRAGRHLLRRRGPRRWRCPRCSTPRTPSTAAAAAPRTSTTPIYLGHLGRYRCPSCGQERPAPTVAAEQIELDGTRAARFTLRTPAGRARGRRCRSRASTTSTTRSARPRCAWRSGVSLEHDRRRPRGA